VTFFAGALRREVDPPLDLCAGAAFGAGAAGAVAATGAATATSGAVVAMVEARWLVRTVGICLTLGYRPVSATASAPVTALMTTAESMTVRATRFMCCPLRIALLGSADIVP
jgi:hypothetical protein